MNYKILSIIILMTITTLINNMAHPVTPKLLGSQGYGAFVLGIVFAAMSFSNFFMSPIWGSLSDSLGRKRFMVMAPIGYSIAQLGFGFSTSPIIIVLFRLLAGGTACASFVCGMAYIVDITSPKNRSKVLAIYTALTGFSGNLGYLLGGYIGRNDYHDAFITQSILSFLSAFLILIFLKENKVNKKITRKINYVKDFMKYSNTLLPFLLLIVILTSIISIGFNTGFSSYMSYELAYDSFKMGIIMAIFGAVGLITNILIFPFLKRFFNDFYLLLFSILLMSTSLILVTYYDNMDTKIKFLVVFFAFMAVYRPLLQSLIAKLGEYNGEVMGLNNAANGIGMVIGSLMMGKLFEINISLSFYTLSIIGLIAFVLLTIPFKSLKKIAN